MSIILSGKSNKFIVVKEKGDLTKKKEVYKINSVAFYNNNNKSLFEVCVKSMKL